MSYPRLRTLLVSLSCFSSSQYTSFSKSKLFPAFVKLQKTLTAHSLHINDMDCNIQLPALPKGTLSEFGLSLKSAIEPELEQLYEETVLAEEHRDAMQRRVSL